MDEQEQKYSVELETALHEYAESKSKTAGLDPVELYEARQSIRPGQEAAANEKLEQVFGEKYSPLRWMDAKRAQMRLTNDSVEEYAARADGNKNMRCNKKAVRPVGCVAFSFSCDLKNCEPKAIKQPGTPTACSNVFCKKFQSSSNSKPRHSPSSAGSPPGSAF